MAFFRDEDCLTQLSPDDRVEIFQSILLGSSDITKDLLEDLCNEYDVDNLEIIDTDEDE